MICIILEKKTTFLIPTAEVPLTNMYKEEILYEEQLPNKMLPILPVFEEKQVLMVRRRVD